MLFLSWLYAYYCFDYKWALEGIRLPNRLHFFECNWAYFAGEHRGNQHSSHSRQHGAARHINGCCFVSMCAVVRRCTPSRCCAPLTEQRCRLCAARHLLCVVASQALVSRVWRPPSSGRSMWVQHWPTCYSQSSSWLHAGRSPWKQKVRAGCSAVVLHVRTHARQLNPHRVAVLG